MKGREEPTCLQGGRQAVEMSKQQADTVVEADLIE
jgi:hypothetical protein